MDSLKRLDRIKHNGQHVRHMAIIIGAGYMIALIIYMLLIFLLGSM